MKGVMLKGKIGSVPEGKIRLWVKKDIEPKGWFDGYTNEKLSPYFEYDDIDEAIQDMPEAMKTYGGIDTKVCINQKSVDGEQLVVYTFTKTVLQKKA